MKTFIRYAREKDREIERRERKRERGRAREINKIEIDTYLFVKGNQEIKLGRFRQNITKKRTLQEKVT